MPGIIDTSKIDLITRTKEGTAELVIIEEGEWKGNEEQTKLFLEKMKTYLTYLRGGQFQEMYPDLASKPATIKVVSSYKFDSITKQLFDRVAEDIKSKHQISLLFHLMKREQPTS